MLKHFDTAHSAIPAEERPPERKATACTPAEFIDLPADPALGCPDKSQIVTQVEPAVIVQVPALLEPASALEAPLDEQGRAAAATDIQARIKAARFPPCHRKSVYDYPVYRAVIDKAPPSGFSERLDVILADVEGVEDPEVVAYVLYWGDYHPPAEEQEDGGRQLIRDLASLEPYGRLLQCRLLSAQQRFTQWVMARSKAPKRGRK
jgi:hypothetical protein